MGIGAFGRLKNIFSSASANEAERQELFKEVLLLTLARASHADAVVNPAEVDAVQQVVARETGENVSEADVRVAAASELYETAPLTGYLSAATRNLSSAQRATILKALASVIASDKRVATSEVAFFDSVAHALKASPAEIAGIAAS